MKKILMMAAFAAAGAAFTACSSDDTLATQQTPEVPVVKGTPFKVSAFAEGTTRATLYDSDAWDGTNDETWVSNIKVWGKQPSAPAEEIWMNNVVFERETYNGEWSPVRNNDGNIASLSWPTTNTGEETTFYAITDNAIGSTTGNPVTGVTWTPASGTFTYEMPTKTENISWYDLTEYDFISTETTYVDPSKLADLMVAKTEKTEAQTEGGTLPLAFNHALSGLVIKAKFLSDAESNSHVTATVKSIMVCGLNTAGTYSYSSSSWTPSTPIAYYKELSQVIAAQAEDTAEESVNVYTLVPSGEWMVIPQSTTTTAWDLSVNENSYPSAAYISVKVYDSNTKSDILLTYSLNTTFNPAMKRVITIDIAQGRVIEEDYYKDPKVSGTDGKADLFYGPTTVTGA